MQFREHYTMNHLDTPYTLGSDDKNLKREIHLAQQIQTQLLNGPTPEIKDSEVSGTSIPARLVGGDYYDFYQLPNGKLRIIIGDVMGKGIPAAMLMILTRGAFRSASENTISPAETLTAMNNALCADLRSLKSFVTVLCADWDPKDRTLTYANAGHTSPLLIRSTGVEDIPKSKGIMLGGLPNQVYKEKTVTLEREDCVFFYTDGIIEAKNTEGELFDIERLKKLLFQQQGNSVREIEEAVTDAVHLFAEGKTQSDDITMVLLKVEKEKTDISSFTSPKVEGLK